MAEKRQTQPSKPALLRSVLIGVVSGVISSTIVAAGAYHLVRENLSMMVAEGLRILNVQDTTKSLSDIVSSCRLMSASLMTPTTRPTDETIDNLITAVKQLKADIAKIKETDYYSAAELRQLTAAGHMSDQRMRILQEYKNKPKRIVTGLPTIKPQITAIEEMLHGLDRELREQPGVDARGMRELIATIETTAAAAHASLESRETATLLTLEKFGKQK